HRISWYPQVGLDLTLGASGEPKAVVGHNALGKRLDTIETGDCFGCHCTWLPTDDKGRFDLQRMVAGVQCARCHLNGEEHVRAMSVGNGDSKMERWSDLSPLESIRR